MIEGKSGKLQISQGYEVLVPKSGAAYPVPCGEWDYLRGRLSKVSDPPWLFQSLGFLLLGACLSTFITILTAVLNGSFSSNSTAGVVAWAAVGVTGICGIALLYLGRQQRRLQIIEVAEVVKQMELIEQRYDRKEA